ncbi:MAG: hypothetical protein M3N08_05665 [Pseudomonadota bacterium]|nr:hypothetical protein [Pseudomonadota bacterium]
MNLNRYHSLRHVPITLLLGAGIALSASPQDTKLVPDASSSSAQPDPQGEVAVAETYSADAIRRVSAVLGQNPDVLFLQADKIAGAKDPAALLPALIKEAAEEKGWPADRVARTLEALDGDVFGNSKGAEVLFGKIKEAAHGFPGAYPLPDSQDPLTGRWERACLVALPTGLNNPWELDRNFFASVTGLDDPERSLPSAEKVHAFFAEHEQAHCVDRNLRSAFVALGNVGGGEKTEDAQWRPVFSAAALKLEVAADTAAVAAHFRVYRDPEFFTAIRHARAMASFFDWSHATQDSLRQNAPGRLRSSPYAPAEIVEGNLKTANFLLEKCALRGDDCATDKEVDPKKLYVTLISGLKSGEIAEPLAVKGAKDYAAGYEYFEPTKAGLVLKELGMDPQPLDHVFTASEIDPPRPKLGAFPRLLHALRLHR